MSLDGLATPETLVELGLETVEERQLDLQKFVLKL